MRAPQPCLGRGAWGGGVQLLLPARRWPVRNSAKCLRACSSSELGFKVPVVQVRSDGGVEVYSIASMLDECIGHEQGYQMVTFWSKLP